MLRRGIVVLAVLTLLLIQVSVLRFAEIGGRTPDLLLILVSFLALRLRPFEASLTGWAVGLSRDFLTGGRLGLYALLFMAMAFVVTKLARRLKEGDAFSEAAMVLVASLFCYGLYLFYSRLVFGFALTRTVLLTGLLLSLYNAVVAPIVIFFLRRARLVRG